MINIKDYNLKIIDRCTGHCPYTDCKYNIYNGICVDVDYEYFQELIQNKLIGCKSNDWETIVKHLNAEFNCLSYKHKKEYK